MNLEVGTLKLLNWGFHIVYIFSIGVLIRLWLKDYKNKAYIWFYAQLFVLYLSVQKFFKFIKLQPEAPHIMISEENSLLLGTAGLYWGINICFMLIGIWYLGKKDKS